MLYSSMTGKCIRRIAIATLSYGSMLLPQGCGGSENYDDGTLNTRSTKFSMTVDERLQGPLDRFNQDCNSPPNRIDSIEVGELDGTAIGRCYWGNNGRNHIVIKPSMLSVDPILLEATMYHELGHCQLNLQHSSDESSMMFPTLYMDAEFVQAKWDTMVQSICGDK